MRIFVTFTLFLSVLACDRSESHQRDVLRQGQEKLSASEQTENDLKQHQIVLLQSRAPAKELAAQFDWMRISKSERQVIKQELLHYMVLSDQVLELDAQKGFYLTHKDLVLAKRDGAYLFEKSCEDFEKLKGENFEPKNEGSASILKTQAI